MPKKKTLAKKKTTAIVKENKKTPWTQKQVSLITRTVAKGANMDELHLFLYTANKVKLDPLAKQIYFNKFKLKDGSTQMAIITGIDGYRAIAERSGSYAGSDDPIYDGGEHYAPGKEPKNPSKATVTVHRIVSNLKVSFTATARWKEYLPGQIKKQFMWNKMPYLMLGKVAESLALRKAFPNDLSGIKTTEEMMQAGEVIDVMPEAENDIVEPKTTKTTKSPQNAKNEQDKVIEGETEEVCPCYGCGNELSKTDMELSAKLSKDGKSYCSECLKSNRK